METRSGRPGDYSSAVFLVLYNSLSHLNTPSKQPAGWLKGVAELARVNRVRDGSVPRRNIPSALFVTIPDPILWIPNLFNELASELISLGNFWEFPCNRTGEGTITRGKTKVSFNPT